MDHPPRHAEEETRRPGRTSPKAHFNFLSHCSHRVTSSPLTSPGLFLAAQWLWAGLTFQHPLALRYPGPMT